MLNIMNKLTVIVSSLLEIKQNKSKPKFTKLKQ